MNYSVELKINGVDYSEYIQLPFSITETLDETMDTGAMTLNFLEERTPFKPYSECEITLTQPDNVPKKYTMLLESDKVEEIQHGNDSFWKHNLTFIETTYLLSNYYLSDFAITQPITAFAFPKAVPSITEGTFNETLFSFIWPVGRLGYTDKFVLSDTSYSIKTKYISPLNLSNTVMRNWAVNFITSAGRYGSITEVYDSGAFSYTYYYKLHSASTWTQITDISNVPLTEGLYDIKAVMDTNFTFHYKYTSSSPSAYTIVWEDRTANASTITGLSETVLFENIEVAAAITEADIYTIKEGIEKVLGVAKLEEIGEDYDFITLSAEAITKYNLDTLKCPEMTITNNRNLLEVFYDIGKEFNAYPRLNVYSMDTYELRLFYSGTFSLLTTITAGTNYTFDSSTGEITILGEQVINASDYDAGDTFTCYKKSGNTLTRYYVKVSSFLGIGKYFGGTIEIYSSRKKGKYELTFDVLENPRDNSTYEDGDELETEESNMTNYANVLVSNVANMTSSETTKIYPGINRWISCRADPNDITLKKENMSILVDDNINYLVKVKVKNWKTADLSDERDITGYIFEKTVYDSLNKNIDGQGLALYYEKGKNKIVGLGYLPQIQSYINLGPTEHIIQRILTDITAVAKEQQEDPLNFLYQVEYVPYISARVLTHQANNADFDSDYQANYNQETANINAEAFGTDTQKTISRIGNNNVNTMAMVDNISQIPYTGEHKTIDGVEYFANVVTATFNNNTITVSLEYSKDYNKINNRVGIDKEYREYSLYADNYVNRTINIEDFCEVSVNDTQVTPENTYATWAAFYYELSMEFGTKSATRFAYKLACYEADGTTKLKYTPFKGSPTNINEHIIPVSLNALGNSLVFIGSCYDNYSVGQYIDGSSYAFGSCANKDARYVDDYGECPVIKLTLASGSSFNSDTIEDAKLFPKATVLTDPIIYHFKNRLFKINKDNRERIKLVYSQNWYTRQKELSIHNSAIKYIFENSTSDTTDYGNTFGNTILIGYTGNLKNKNIINYTSNDVLNEHDDFIFHTDPYLNDGYFYLQTKSVTPLKNYDGFALVWSGTGEILYSYKQTLIAGVELSSKYFLFSFSKKKLTV